MLSMQLSKRFVQQIVLDGFAFVGILNNLLDCYKGPEQDRDRKESDYFWIFKKKISWQVIYIKFKVEYQIDGGVKVVSFHIDENLPSN